MSYKDEYDAFQKALSLLEINDLPEVLKDKYAVSRVLSSKEGRAIYYAEQRETGQKCVIKATANNSPDSAKREYDFLAGLMYMIN